MKAPKIAIACLLLGIAACSAPQGKKLATSGSGLAPVATGPNSELAPVASGPAVTANDGNLTIGNNNETVNIPTSKTVTLTLDAAKQEGYTWRLSEIPDPSVLKIVSEEYVPPATPGAVGQQKWVFQAVAPGDVNVKMWYGNTLVSPLSGNPKFDFVASVNDEIVKPEKPAKKAKKKPQPKVAEL